MELRFCDRWNVVCICRIESQRTIQERKTEDIITQKNNEHRSYIHILESDYATCKVSSCTFFSLKFIFSNIIHVCVWTLATWDIVCVCVCVSVGYLRKLKMTKKLSFIYGLMAFANNGFYDMDWPAFLFLCVKLHWRFPHPPKVRARFSLTWGSFCGFFVLSVCSL